MSQTHTLVGPVKTAKRAATRRHWYLASIVAALAFAAPLPARAVDGCLALLCLAAPNWRGIQQCVPTVVQVLRDLARGRPFPSCSTAGAGNAGAVQWANAPSFCPPQYTRAVETESATFYTCDYAGAISVSIDGRLFARTWWNPGGDTVTEFSTEAKSRLGSIDTKFDDDFALWLAQQPPAPVSPLSP